MSSRNAIFDLAIEPLESRLLLAAQAYDWNAAVIKANGFIDGIVYSPAAPNTVYMHTDMGGAYRWDQPLGKWMPLNDWSRWNDWSPQNLGVETMAVDPVDPNRVYMAAGTYMSPTAILRSTDGGRTWLRTDVSGINSNGNGSARNAGERMVVDPNSPNILYYGTRDDGLWKSLDYGATWNNVPSFPTIGEDSGVGQDTGIVWVLPDASSATVGNPTQTIYAGVVTVSDGLTRIYRTIDGGTSWQALPGGQPTTANYFPQRAALTPDGSALYITYGFSTSYPGPYGITEGAVYKASNPGSGSPVWSDISPPVTYGFSAVELDPVDPNTIYVSELGNYNPADRIWKSTTGGGGWTVISPNSNRNDSSAPYASSLGVHWLGDLQIDPFNRNVAMFTTGYGLYRTTNFTSANPGWTFFNEGFEQSAVLELSSPSSGAVNLLSAIGDRDGYRHLDLNQSSSIGRHGQNNGLARGTSDDIDSAFDNASYVVRTVRSSPYVQYSNDNGITWNWFPNTTGSGSGPNLLAISADGSKVVYEPGGSGRARYSTRNGSTWSAWTSSGITNQPENGAQIVAEQVAGSRTFYAYQNTTVSQSTNGGASWTIMSTTAPSAGNWIRAVPGQAGHLLMSRNSGGLWRTTDGGASWTQVSSGVVTIANQVGVGAGPTAGSYPSIYVGGTVGGQPGFFRSDDQGATWTMISDLAHQFGYVTVIQGDARVYGRLYVGTNGRGIQYGDIHASPSSLPANWSSQDIGTPGSSGASGESAGTWEVIGGGSGIASIVDQFRYTYTALNGDGIITARVLSNPSASPTNHNAKAGVMIRNTLAANSAHAFMSMSPGSVNGAVFVSRSVAAGSTNTTTAPGIWNPYWVRLTRVGNTFTAERSADGTSWLQVGSTQTIAMNSSVFIGLAVTAADNNQLNIARFDNVSVASGNVSVSGTSIDDAIRIERNGQLTEVRVNGILSSTFDPTTATALVVNARLAGNDTVTVDFASGDPLPASTSLEGDAGSDTVEIIGTSAADSAVFNATSVEFNGSTASHSGFEQAMFDRNGSSDSLTINSGARVSFGGMQRLASLTIADGGLLDLRDNDLILDYNTGSPLGQIQSLINSGRNNGSWDGSTGVTSSSAAADIFHITTIGAIEASEYFQVHGQGAFFDDESIDDSTVLVKYTYYGDSDFNGVVDFDDYVRMDTGFNQQLSGWFNGDLDGNGAVDFDDYVLIDAAFNQQGGNL